MIELIEKLLKQLKIPHYTVTQVQAEGVELYFIKKQMDMKRLKHTNHYSVTVYNDFEKDAVKMRGSATVEIYESMTEPQIKETLEEAYYAASFVNNPYYPLPEPAVLQEGSGSSSQSRLSGLGLGEVSEQVSEALFKYDCYEKGWVNSAEVFVTMQKKRLVSSTGIDVNFEKYRIKGEFIIQWCDEQDVENYFDFNEDDLRLEALSEKVREALLMTKERACAKQPPKSGSYPVILSDQYVVTLLHYYNAKASAAMIYPRYSHFKVGEQVQSAQEGGDALTITLLPTEPYSMEGIPMVERPLLDEGVLQTIHGHSRFSHYLGIEPIGQYSGIRVNGGSMKFEEMKTGEYLHIVSFSDFQIDTFTGHFGSEIRLAFYCDGNNITPVTGGSLSGSLIELAKTMKLSEEIYQQEGYSGPKAVKLFGAHIGGA